MSRFLAFALLSARTTDAVVNPSTSDLASQAELDALSDQVADLQAQMDDR